MRKVTVDEGIMLIYRLMHLSGKFEKNRVQKKKKMVKMLGDPGLILLEQFLHSSENTNFVVTNILLTEIDLNE